MGICDMRLNRVCGLVVREYGVGEFRVGKVGSVVSIESVVVVVRLKVETDDSDACLIYDRPRKEREFENELPECAVTPEVGFLLHETIGIDIKVAKILV